ncbi:Exc2 family lipoprotein [Winslowiella iniecta]|uniref:Exc2 family lipoprotein n=1 Tax=Winslowiella iniecta TaxID=1560201 RepID=UPI0009E244A5|nr:Exc2 family lipoprotein [Winslowiella iniecta]
MLIACGFLAACTTAKTSSQKHAEHYVYQMRNERDVNYRTLVSDSIKRAVPMFDWFYQQGVADRMAKLPRAEAQKKVDYFKSDEFQNQLTHTQSIINHEYKEQVSDKKRQIFTA